MFRNVRERFGIADQDYMVSTALLTRETGIDDQDYMVSTALLCQKLTREIQYRRPRLYGKYCPIVSETYERFGIDDQDYMVSTALLCSETYKRDSV